jgi:hypothetical protein
MNSGMARMTNSIEALPRWSFRKPFFIADSQQLQYPLPELDTHRRKFSAHFSLLSLQRDPSFDEDLASKLKGIDQSLQNLQ